MINQLQHKIDTKTKPLGSLGLLESIALQIGTIQNTLSPHITKPCILVCAADHGITDEGVSPYPKDVTWQMVMNFVTGGAAISVFCKQHNIELMVVDAGVDYDFPKQAPIIHAKIARGTQNMLHAPAMSMQHVTDAMQAGADIVRTKVTDGSNCIGFGEMGIGNTSSSSLIMHAITGIPLYECVGAGTGMVGDKLAHKLQVLQQVATRHSPKTAYEILACFGGLEIAMICGGMLEAYKQNCIILIDGFITTAALLIAHAIEPNILSHCIYTHVSDEQGHEKMLAFLNATPILHLGLRLGEGSGAAVAFPIILSALAFVNEMSSFEDAKVDGMN